MRAGQASRTAEHNALFRALESSRPPDRRLFVDPYAAAFLTGPLSLVARGTLVPGWRDLVCALIDRRWPGVRTSVVARTKLIDDAIAVEVAAAPVEQVVILGAGYDSRAYRLDCLRDLAVFEVDHPDTQDAKRRALAQVLPESPAPVRYVASDFHEDRLGAQMRAAGLRAEGPSILLWEGVTNYLTEAAVDSTLQWCARAAPGSLLIFTYIDRQVLEHPERYAGSDRLRATLAKAGEQLTFGIDPASLPELLRARGLVLERDLGAAQYRELAFGEAAHAMRGHEFYRVAFARVGCLR